MKNRNPNLPSGNYEQVPYTSVEGKVISTVYNTFGQWSAHASGTRVPGSGKLFNFDLKVGAETFLVLDPYGNEFLDEEMEAHIFGGHAYDDENPGWVLAICRRTGAIYQMSFGKDGRKFIATFWEFGGSYGPPGGNSMKVPVDYLSRLDELKSMKRPFDVTLGDRALFAFVEREIGYSELRQEVVIRLDFHSMDIEIWRDSYREVGNWRNV